MAFDTFAALKEGWLKQVLRDPLLKDSSKVVATLIFLHLNRRTRTAYPGIARLMQESGRKKDTIIRAVKDLCDRRHLDVTQGGGRKQDTNAKRGLQGQTNVYRPVLHDDTIAELRQLEVKHKVAILRPSKVDSEGSYSRRTADRKMSAGEPSYSRSSGDLTVAGLRPEPLRGTYEEADAPSGARRPAPSPDPDTRFDTPRRALADALSVTDPEDENPWD